ncbi:MAG: hypothetical protein JO253_08270 [Alphaproteobacteria bacterium]|nr:hypothetical protein [Alphaproteobacteria bacterium]
MSVLATTAEICAGVAFMAAGIFLCATAGGSIAFFCAGAAVTLGGFIATAGGILRNHKVAGWGVTLAVMGASLGLLAHTY